MLHNKEVISFERTRSNRVNMQDVSTPKVFVSYKTDSIATCSLETDHLFTLHRSMSLYQIMLHIL